MHVAESPSALQGGSVVVKACSRIQSEVRNVIGVCNLDVVEGTVIQAH